MANTLLVALRAMFRAAAEFSRRWLLQRHKFRSSRQNFSDDYITFQSVPEFWEKHCPECDYSPSRANDDIRKGAVAKPIMRSAPP